MADEWSQTELLTPILNYNHAFYLVGILQPISTNQHTVKDSFSFTDWAKTYKHNNGIMCSLDVTSLFTNVPLDETIQICVIIRIFYMT